MNLYIIAFILAGVSIFLAELDYRLRGQDAAVLSLIINEPYCAKVYMVFGRWFIALLVLLLTIALLFGRSSLLHGVDNADIMLRLGVLSFIIPLYVLPTYMIFFAQSAAVRTDDQTVYQIKGTLLELLPMFLQNVFMAVIGALCFKEAALVENTGLFIPMAVGACMFLHVIFAVVVSTTTRSVRVRLIGFATLGVALPVLQFPFVGHTGPGEAGFMWACFVVGVTVCLMFYTLKSIKHKNYEQYLNVKEAKWSLYASFIHTLFALAYVLLMFTVI